jgi:hypothetical protein
MDISSILEESNRKTLIIAVASALVGALVLFFYWDSWFPPDPADRVAKVGEAPNGALIYDGELYPSQWTKDEEFGGIVNQVTPGYSDLLPFLTHKVLLVTGDYADPSKVQISEDRKVTRLISTPPEGMIRLVHIMPADAAALEELKKLQPGQWATLQGDVLTGALVIPGQRKLQMRGETKVFRLRTVSLDEPE